MCPLIGGKMFYTIYKTTNLLNGKFYVGMHKTKDLNDGYVGSGKILRHAISKYGIENFVTETLEVYDNEHHMKLAERILVVLDTMSYNLCDGGKGGFGYINQNVLTKEQRKTNGKKGGDKPKDYSIGGHAAFKKHGLQKSFITAGLTAFKGKKHSDETKAKMRAALLKNIALKQTISTW